MTADLKFVNISGTRLDFLASGTIGITLLCGVAGGRVTPLELSPEGWILQSGTNLDL